MDAQILGYIKKELAERVTTVSFTKIDGEVRVMDCTKNMDLIPPSKWPKNEKIVEESEDTIRAFDVKAQDWRSFRIDRIFAVDSEKLSVRL